MHKRWSHLFAYLIFCTTSLAQEYSFVKYTPKDGLINSRVKSAFQDSRGRLFFLTSGGLSIYDGSVFKNYSVTEGLANNVINDVYEAGPDSFFIATNSETLNTLIRGKIGVFKTADNFCPVINHFLKSTDQNLYVAADQGIFVMKNNRFVEIPVIVDTSGRKAEAISFIDEWKNYFILGTWNDNSKEKNIVYDKTQKKVLDITYDHLFTKITHDLSKSRLFVTASGGLYTLDTIKLNEGKISLISYKNLPSNLLPSFTRIYFNNADNKWLFSSSAIAREVSNGNFEILNDKAGLNTSNINDIFWDHEDVLWILTDGSGVIKLPNTYISVLHGLMNDNKGSIISLNCTGDTTWAYENNSNRVISISSKSKNIYFLNIKSNCLSFCLTGNRLAITDNKTVYLINNKNNPSSYNPPEIIYTLKDNNKALGKIISDNIGNLYLCVWGIDTANYMLTITANGQKKIYHSNQPMDEIITDRNKHLWAVTRGGDLFLFNQPSAENNYQLELVKNYKTEIPFMNSRSITIDKQNNVWIGTRDSGVYRLVFNDLIFKKADHLSSKNGLTDNFIYSLACDNYNHIWAATQSGLDKITLKKGEEFIIENISKNNNIFETVTHISIDSANTVWALCNRGDIIKVENQASKKSLYDPSLFITGLKINGIDSNITSKPLILNYDENNISFSVAAPSFIAEHSAKFSYLLEGSSNTKWSEPSNNSSFNLLNLSPGKYTLKIKASFPANMYPEKEISYSFEVLAPWWQTGWFRTIFIIGVAGLLFLFIRSYYTRKLEKQKIFLEKQQAIEKERTRIATDMHDDLGAGLSRIKFLSETIGLKKQQQLPIEEDISKIRDYSHEMIDKMGEIVWALNEKNDSLSDLISYTRSYTMEYLSQNGIIPGINIPEELPSLFVTGEFRRNVFLTIKEALHNIIKHSQATRVDVIIQASPLLSVSIRDNGTGFNINDQRPFSNGLTNMQKRIFEIGGIIEIKTNSLGTLVSFTVPLPL